MRLVHTTFLILSRFSPIRMSLLSGPCKDVKRAEEEEENGGGGGKKEEKENIRKWGTGVKLPLFPALIRNEGKSPYGIAPDRLSPSSTGCPGNFVFFFSL